MFLVILCVLLVAGKINAQQQVSEVEARQDTTQRISNFKHHSIYVEFLGSSTFYSVNYDYLFRIYKDNIKLVVGAGIGYFALRLEKRTTHYFYFTPETNFLFGGKSHYCEAGTAFMTGISNKRVGFFPSGRIGYRYQPQKGGFLFRIAYTPIFREDSWVGFNYLLFGISFGYIF